MAYSDQWSRAQAGKEDFILVRNCGQDVERTGWECLVHRNSKDGHFYVCQLDIMWPRAIRFSAART